MKTVCDILPIEICLSLKICKSLANKIFQANKCFHSVRNIELNKRSVLGQLKSIHLFFKGTWDNIRIETVGAIRSYILHRKVFVFFFIPPFKVKIFDVELYYQSML